MRAKDLQTLETFLAEYGSKGTGAPSYGQVAGKAAAKKTMSYAKDLAGGQGGPAASATQNAARDQEQGAEIKKVQSTTDKIVGDAQEGDELEVDGEKAQVISPAGEGDDPDVVVVQTANGEQHKLDPNIQLGESMRKLAQFAGRARTDESRAKVRGMIEKYLMPEPTAVDRFLDKPLDQQLLMLEHVDPPRPLKKISEGAVPNNSSARVLNKLLNEHFPVGDYGKQMQAYIALPVPSMLRDFWALEANEGPDACARWILREYIKNFAPDAIRSEVKLKESAQGNLRAILVTEKIQAKVGRVRDERKEKILVQSYVYDPSAKTYAETDIWARGMSKNSDAIVQRVQKKVKKQFGVEPEMSGGVSVFMRWISKEGYKYDESLLNASITESQDLNEAVLAMSELIKHAGRYLDAFLDAIRDGRQIKVDPHHASRFGEFVIIEPKEADRIAKIFYPDGDPEKVKLDSNGRIVPANPPARGARIMLQTTEGDTVPITVIDKSPFRGKNYNKGDVAEAYLGLAVASFFVNKKQASEDKIKELVNLLEFDTDGRNWTGTFQLPIQHGGKVEDVLSFRVSMRAASLDMVRKHASGEAKDKGIDGLLKSAVAYSNAIDVSALEEAYELIKQDPKQNVVEVISDGVSDQTGTKADLIMAIDGKSYNLLSIKAGSIKQFGQISGYTWDVVSNFIERTFGVRIPKKYKQLDWGAASRSLKSFMTLAEDFLIPELQRKFSGGPESDQQVVQDIFNGIVYHATSNEPGVDLVILKDTPNSPGFNVLRFDDTLLENLKKVDLDVYVAGKSESSITFKIAVSSWTDPELEAKYNKKYSRAEPVLLQIRSGVIFEKKDYMRNRIEMGPVLKFLAEATTNET